MNNATVKENLLNELHQHIDIKIHSIRAAIKDISDSMKNDTKSSAGDKFETGREMMQIELSKLHAQLNKQLQLKKDLFQIDLSKQHSEVDFGSLVFTNKGNYLISVALGKISIDNKDYFALSLASPIGQKLKGKQPDETINFNNQLIKVLDVQ